MHRQRHKGTDACGTAHTDYQQFTKDLFSHFFPSLDLFEYGKRVSAWPISCLNGYKTQFLTVAYGFKSLCSLHIIRKYE